MDLNRKRVLALAEEGEWMELVELVEMNHALAKAQDDFGMLPLHWACTEPTILLDLFKALLQAFPDGCTIENLSGMMPLHVAINSKMPGLHINALLQAHPEVALTKDGTGRYAVELAMQMNLPKFTLDLIRKAGGRAMRSTSFAERSMSLASSFVESSAFSFSLLHNGSTCSLPDMASNQDEMEQEKEDFQKEALVKAQSLDSLMATRQASMYAHLVDEKLPASTIDHMESAEISSQLKGLLSQLQQLSVDIRTSTSTSTASTYRSSFSSSSSVGGANANTNSVLWNPADKLGLVFEPINNDTGAQIKRFSKSNALGVEALHEGDILMSINGTSVVGTSYASIVRFLKHSKVTCTLCFSKGIPSFSSSSPLEESQVTDSDALLFTKVTELLTSTMKKVSAVEETVRLSSAMSFCA